MNEITKKQLVISISNSAELYIDEEKLPELEKAIEKQQFIKIQGQIINKSHIIGIFKPETIEATTRRKNGQWQKDGKWYNKGDKPCNGCGQVIPYGKECGRCRGY